MSKSTFAFSLIKLSYPINSNTHFFLLQKVFYAGKAEFLPSSIPVDQFDFANFHLIWISIFLHYYIVALRHYFLFLRFFHRERIPLCQLWLISRAVDLECETPLPLSGK